MMLKKEKSVETLGTLIKEARIKKGMSARKLASLIGYSHTEINNIEKGLRVKPSILVLKALEQYLDIPFNKSAKLAGYSEDTIKYGEEDVIVSYEMYDKKIREIKEELKYAEFRIDQKRHVGMDAHEYFKEIHDYLKKQKNIDKKLLNKADAIEKFLIEIEREYDGMPK